MLEIGISFGRRSITLYYSFDDVMVIHVSKGNRM